MNQHHNNEKQSFEFNNMKNVKIISQQYSICQTHCIGIITTSQLQCNNNSITTSYTADNTGSSGITIANKNNDDKNNHTYTTKLQSSANVNGKTKSNNMKNINYILGIGNHAINNISFNYQHEQDDDDDDNFNKNVEKKDDVYFGMIDDIKSLSNLFCVNNIDINSNDIGLYCCENNTFIWNKNNPSKIVRFETNFDKLQEQYYNDCNIFEPIVFNNDIIVDIKGSLKHYVGLSNKGNVYTWGFTLYGATGTTYDHCDIDNDDTESISNTNSNTNQNQTEISENSSNDNTSKNKLKLKSLQSLQSLQTNSGTELQMKEMGNINDIKNSRNNCNELYTKPKAILWFLSPMINVIDIGCGIWHSCVLSDNGSVYTFGLNCDGQLGIGKDIPRANDPQLVIFANDNDNGEDVECKKLSCGARHNCVLDEKGQLWLWGYNKYKQVSYDLDCGDCVWLPKKLDTKIQQEFDTICNIVCGHWTTIIQGKGKKFEKQAGTRLCNE